MNVAIVEVTQSPLVQTIAHFFQGEGHSVFQIGVRNVPEFWKRVDLLVFVASTGIALRVCAPLLREKARDPGVIVVDTRGNFCIALSGGHRRNVNAIVFRLAPAIGAEPVVTTASDAGGLFSPEEVAFRLGASLEERGNALRKILRRLVQGETIDFYFAPELSPPPFPGYRLRPWDGKAGGKEFVFFGEQVFEGAHVALRPRSLVLAVGFRKHIPCTAITQACEDFFARFRYSPLALREIVTLEGKENVLSPLGEQFGVPVRGVPRDALSQIQGEITSPCAMKHLGIPGLVEPALVLLGCEILVGKTVYPGMTFALGRKYEKRHGLLYLVSLGAGGTENLTLQALSALRDSEWILGYRKYLRSLPPGLAPRILWEYTEMGQEVERAERAVALAAGGNRVALVSSGDVGVFGMVSPALEIALRRGVPWRIVPGVSACLYAASRLGSPLVGGFAVVSLSDYLVPWGSIQNDLERLAATDLAVAVYNIVHRGREEKIAFLKAVFSRARGEDLPVGIVWESGAVEIIPLGLLESSLLSMQCTLVIPPKRAYRKGNTLVVARGYAL